MLEPSGVFYTDEQHDALISGHRRQVADLQGQVEAHKLVIDDHHRLVRELDVAMNGTEGAAKQASLCDLVSQIQALQQRVAQLEGERDMYKRSSDTFAECVDNIREAMGLETTHYLVLPDDVQDLRDAHTTLQADHARVLGLVQALPVVPKEYLTDDFVHLGVPVTATLWAQIGPDLIALLTYRASLPAQPAQGSAASKPVTTCNRHSDCDAADEKARAKGALHADHCHDDCCSECFGN